MTTALQHNACSAWLVNPSPLLRRKANVITQNCVLAMFQHIESLPKWGELEAFKSQVSFTEFSKYNLFQEVDLPQ